MKEEVRFQITQSLNKHAQNPGGISGKVRLVDCAKIARAIGIQVDEDIQECKEGKQLATTLVDNILLLDTDTDSTAKVKDMMLPLQSSKMWQTWAKHDKEQYRHIHRGSSGIEQYNSEKEKEKIAIREKQLKLAHPPSPVMKLFISTLLQHKMVSETTSFTG